MVATPEARVDARPEPASPPARLRYEPALDGLRAVAAGSVLLYHGGVTWSSGGFLGVDVFFVLSGFLITSLLVSEWLGTGGIRIVSFYGRRIRRLFPALLLVLAAVAVYAATLAPPSQLRELRGDELSTLAYITNWRLVLAHRGYFDAFTLASPLKHTWSLAVEEQWYLIWPIVVVGLLMLTRRWRNGVVVALGITAALCVASTLWMVHLYTPGGDPSRVYYGTDTRAQELLAGAVLAFGCAVAGRFTVGPRWKLPVRVGGALAFVGMFALFALVDDTTRWLYEGGLLLYSFAVALVILAAIQPHGIVRTVLSPRPLRWLGMISYGLFLWHWPIYVVLDPDRTGLDGPRLLFLRLAVTVAAATASYYVVERPIRQRTFTRRQLFVGAPAVIAAVLVVVLLVTSGAPGTPPAIAAVQGAANAPATTPPKGLPAGGDMFKYEGDKQLPPPTAPGTDPVKLAFTGDSQALTLTFGFGVIPPADLVWDRSSLGCTLFPGDRIADGTASDGGPQCAPWRNDRDRWLAQWKPDVVAVLSGVWETYDREVDGKKLTFGTPAFDRWFLASLDSLVADLGSTGAKVVYLTAPYNDRPTGVNGASFPENDAARINHVNQLYRESAARNPGRAYVVDLNHFLDPDGHFTSTLDGVTVRWDDGVHFSTKGAELTKRWLLPKLAKIARDTAAAA